MKKLILIFLIFMMLDFKITLCQSQNWKVLCVRRPLTSIQFISNSKAWIFGGDIAYYSNNSGECWSSPILLNQPIGGLYLNTGLRSSNLIQFIDSLHGWAAQYNNILCKTSNGGMNWVPVNTGSSNYCYETVYFLNRSTGWIGGWNSSNNNGVIAKTTNEGINWIIQSDNFYREIRSIWMLNGQKGIIVPVQYDSIGVTVDGGNSWAFQKVGNGQPLVRVLFIDTLNGWVLGSYHYNSKTTNGGNNWTYLPNNIGNTINLYFLNNLLGWITGPASRIWKTYDGGVNWVQQHSNGAWDYLYYKYILDIHFKNENTGWALVGDGSVLKSTNGGSNWMDDIYGPFGHVKSIQFLDSTTGYAISNYEAGVIYSSNNGYVWKTTDHGRNWKTQLITKNNEYVTNIRFLNNQTGFVTGNSKIFHTTNGGNIWDTQFVGNKLLNSVYFINQFTGWSCGNGGNLVKTTNSGNNWIVINFGNSKNLHSIYFINSTLGFAGSDSGAIFKSVDGGFNWSISNPAGNKNVNMIVFINSTTGFLIGNRTNTTYPYIYTQRCIMKTTNAGNGWFTVINETVNGTLCFNSLFFPNLLSGWLVTDNGVYRSTNCGENWSLQNSPVNEKYFGVHFINSQVGWISGSNGIIISTGDFAIGVKNENKNEIPSFPSLSQNYPNPFNPLTKIKYDIPPSKGARVMMTRLIIYDILGREIETLVNETQKPGSYEVTWDGSRYASGVYFYRLITDVYVETKKMVLIK